ncbi:CTP synthetase [uncultured Shimia sp.]|uniref:CTP synthetase n=1 Tax=uncultured Shimia sp. TaxID=573152 RepID=UPI0026341A25|nr:CTP synthetase [uncultured Shimia sp.]
MLRLALILHLFIGSTIAGSAVVAALATGNDTPIPILIAALVGFFAAIPVSAAVAKKIYALD